MNRILFFIGCIFTLLSAPVLANEGRLIQPSSDYTPEQVIEIQLLGLQASKDDLRGIEQVWVFAHPSNKRVTGPIGRFAQLFTYPAYAPMVGHTSYQYQLIDKDVETARFKVTLTGRDGRAYEYLWDLRKTQPEDVTADTEAGWWMTTGVTAPRTGDAL